MTRSVAVTIILSLAIGCALSQMDMFTADAMNPTQENDVTESPSSTMETCYDSGWSTKCECPESSPNACGHTLTTTCEGGMETTFNTENLTRAECYVPGEWAEWAEWATCNTTCPEAGGWRNRTRECDSATMKPWQNAECNGSSVDFQSCACGEWGSWSDFSACSVTCDGGYQTRQRECQAPATIPDGAGVVCEGDAEEDDECGTDECPLDEDEIANGVYFGLVTSMTVNDYIKIRPLFTTVLIAVINKYCWEGNFDTCCPSKTKPSFSSKKYVPAYVTNATFELKGAFRDEEANELFAMMYLNPDINTNEMCNGSPTPSGRKKRQAQGLSGSIASSAANSPSFSSAVTATAAKQGFNVTVAKVISASTAASLKASLLTTTIATTVASTASNATTARATAAPPSQLGLIVGVSVGGGLGLVTIILVVVVVVKKKMAKTGIAEITASGEEGAGHQHERRHRELEDGNVAYPAPQYPAAGAVAPVSQS